MSYNYINPVETSKHISYQIPVSSSANKALLFFYIKLYKIILTRSPSFPRAKLGRVRKGCRLEALSSKMAAEGGIYEFRSF